MNAADYPYRFNDVSEFRVITDPAAYQAVNDVLITKATGCADRYGGLFIDPTFGRHRAIGTKLVAMGLYVYIVGQGIKSYQIQADFFSNAIGGLSDNEFIALDIEDSSISDPLNCFKTMTSILEPRHRTQCMIYLPEKFANSIPRSVTENRLIWAPNYNPTEPNWPFDIWQYTDKGAIAGCSQTGDTSVTKFPPEEILSRTGGSIGLLDWCVANPGQFQAILKEVIG